MSATSIRLHQFKTYMQAFLNDVVGVKLTGDPIVLWNGAELHFLGTNYRTAQGRSGNFYFDEFFWVHGFQQINKVASGMALHKKWRVAERRSRGVEATGGGGLRLSREWLDNPKERHAAPKVRARSF